MKLNEFNQASGLHTEEALLVFFFFQQYITLRDMVAAHSIVRMSICRANNGLSALSLWILCVLIGSETASHAQGFSLFDQT